MRSSNWDGCPNAALNTAFPPGPPAKLSLFFPVASGVTWESHSTRSANLAAQESFVVALADRDREINRNFRIYLIVFLLLLPSSVNIIAKEKLLVFQ